MRLQILSALPAENLNQSGQQKSFIWNDEPQTRYEFGVYRVFDPLSKVWQFIAIATRRGPSGLQGVPNLDRVAMRLRLRRVFATIRSLRSFSDQLS